MKGIYRIRVLTARSKHSLNPERALNGSVCVPGSLTWTPTSGPGRETLTLRLPASVATATHLKTQGLWEGRRLWLAFPVCLPDSPTPGSLYALCFGSCLIVG